MIEPIHEPPPSGAPAPPDHVCPFCHTAIHACGESTVYHPGDPPRCMQCVRSVACPIHGVADLHVEPDDPTREALCKHCHDAVTPRHLYRSPRGPLAVLGVVLWTLCMVAVVVGAAMLLCWPVLLK